MKNIKNFQIFFILLFSRVYVLFPFEIFYIKFFSIIIFYFTKIYIMNFC